MKNKKVWIILPILIIVAAILSGGYYVNNNIIETDRIYEGVTVDNISLSNMTKEEAYNYLKSKKESEQVKTEMKLNYEEFNFSISLEDLGFKYEFENAIDEAYNIGREGNYFDRFKQIRNLKNNPKNIELSSNYNFSKVDSIVDNIAEKINIEEQNSEFDFNGGNFIVKDHVVGRNLDSSKLEKLIKDNAAELNDIEIPVETVMPEYTKEFYSSINGVIGEYSTSFVGSAHGRKENIKVSARALNNKLLLPGEELSYNNTIGPIKREFGYLEAPVIVAGDLTPGMGGGVCQTSTTLYNALLLADMKILERSPHSIAATYVPKGQDAAVARGYLDLVFKNEFDFPVYTVSKVVGDTLTFKIYGDTTKKDYTVKIEPELLEKIDYTVIENLDETLAPGTKQLEQDGRTGYKVKTYKTIIKDGKIIKKTPITQDYYRERNYIYKVGPTPPPVEENPGNTEVGESQIDEAVSLDPVVDDPIDKP